MKSLTYWLLAVGIALFAWAAPSASKRNRREIVLALISAIGCIALVCFAIISQGNAIRRVNQMHPIDTSQPTAQEPIPKDDGGVSIEHVSVNGNEFTIARVDLRVAKLRLFWKRSDNTRFGNFNALSEMLREHGQHLIFATNAGIFDPSFTPCGLHVEDGREFVPLNLANGEGNFYMKPNGVFLVDDSGAHILDAEKYDGTKAAVHLATQSGPLLVIDGQINSRFDPHSANRRVRSGVGISSPKAVYFVISNEPVTFHALASVFLSRLGCREALYLDGVISQFDLSGQRADAPAGDFAGILAVSDGQSRSPPANPTDR